MIRGVGDVGLPRRAANAVTVRLDPAFQRSVGFTELIVRPRVRRDGNRTGRKSARLDDAFPLGCRGHRHSHFDAEEPWAGRQVARERPAGNREAEPLRIRKSLAQSFTDGVRNLVAAGAKADDRMFCAAISRRSIDSVGIEDLRREDAGTW